VRSARGAAERAKAAELAPALFDSARRKEREGQRLLASGDLGDAIASFATATALFRQAEGWSRSAPARAAERVVAGETRPVPTRPPAPEPTRLPPTPAAVLAESRPAASRPTDAPRGGRSEEDRVRDALGLYVEAQNSLDVGLYARIYPSLTGERRRMVEQAFENLRSQTLELDVQRVEVNGTRATVSAFERRLAVPRVGSEQRDARQRTISLEKRGDAWVITELR
jgi:hypothetical protein